MANSLSSESNYDWPVQNARAERNVELQKQNAKLSNNGKPKA